MNVGQKIRYKKLGPGIVVGQQVRKFSGQERQFAVIEFPQRQMTVQLPIGDPIVAANVSPLAELSDLQDLLGRLDQPFILQRNWEQRQEQGQQLLDNLDPESLSQLLAAYARAQGAGVALSSADRSLLQEAQELLAAELFLVDEQIGSWEQGQEAVRDYYQQAIVRYQNHGWSAENFAALAQQLDPQADSRDSSALNEPAPARLQPQAAR